MITQVVVVENDPVITTVLRTSLDLAGGVHVVAHRRHGRAALPAVRQLRPTVTLVRYGTVESGALRAVGPLSQWSPVLVLTDDTNPELVVTALRDGARGYLVYEEPEVPDLLRAIQAVAGGQGWLSPLAALAAMSVLRETVVVVPAADRQRQAQLRFGLTRREREVMELLSQGLSNASIAGRLQLTEKTVKNHLNRILGKMRVHNRTEAVVRWTRT